MTVLQFSNRAGKVRVKVCYRCQRLFCPRDPTSNRGYCSINCAAADQSGKKSDLSTQPGGPSCG